MPTNFNIPSRRERHCEPCQYHKCFSAMYGHDYSWRDYNCMHPAAFDDTFTPLSDDPVKAALQGEIRGRLKEHGRHIGKTEIQPDWCPLKREPEKPLSTI